jgi:hypothetical protein
MHPVRQLGQHPAQKVGGGHFGGLRLQLGKGRFAGAVNGPEQLLAAFFGLHFRKIDVQVADGVVLNLLSGHAQPIFRQGQAADAVALKATVQGRTRKVRNRGLPGVEAVVEGQQRVAAKSDGLLLGREHR